MQIQLSQAQKWGLPATGPDGQVAHALLSAHKNVVDEDVGIRVDILNNTMFVVFAQQFYDAQYMINLQLNQLTRDLFLLDQSAPAALTGFSAGHATPDGSWVLKGTTIGSSP